MILSLLFELIAEVAVQLVPYVTRPPRRSSLGDEGCEEHAIEDSRCKVAVDQAPFAEEGRLKIRTY